MLPKRIPRSPVGFILPCRPIKATRPPAGPSARHTSMCSSSRRLEQLARPARRATLGRKATLARRDRQLHPDCRVVTGKETISCAENESPGFSNLTRLALLMVRLARWGAMQQVSAF